MEVGLRGSEGEAGSDGSWGNVPPETVWWFSVSTQVWEDTGSGRGHGILGGSENVLGLCSLRH